MRIDAATTSLPPLRLVRGPESATLPLGDAIPKPIGDSYSFDAVYVGSLPRVPVTDAHLRLQQLREMLVAGQTPVPVHFVHPLAARAANPYVPNYLRLVPSPAEVNAAAFEQQT